MDNWLRAKNELMYRIKQKADELRKNEGLTEEASMALAEREMTENIRICAYLMYQTTKDHGLDDWLQTEWECNQMPYFNARVDNLVQENVQLSGYSVDPEAVREIVKIEFKRNAAYYIWENRCRAEDDWYHAEKSNEIDKSAQNIVTEMPYLSKEEATCCAKHRLDGKIRERAYYRRGWIAEKAYFLGLNNPNNSEYENWCRAAKEYDNL